MYTCKFCVSLFVCTLSHLIGMDPDPQQIPLVCMGSKDRSMIYECTVVTWSISSRFNCCSSGNNSADTICKVPLVALLILFNKKMGFHFASLFSSPPPFLLRAQVGAFHQESTGKNVVCLGRYLLCNKNN